MFDTIHLTNMLRSEVEGVPETGLPLDAFPDKIQEIILNLARYENFNVEYTASIVLSAVATAIGNSCHIRIKGEWKTCPSLYMMLVGRPGLGKTPPLGFIYKPINEYDDRLHEKYNEEYDEYVCIANIDEDEYYRVMSNRRCQYFRFGDDYTIVKKQM